MMERYFLSLLKNIKTNRKKIIVSNLEMSKKNENSTASNSKTDEEKNQMLFNIVDKEERSKRYPVDESEEDFEATCNKHNQPDPQEIIEFPCLMVDTCHFIIHSKFHQYVKPRKHPELSHFCTSLTRISQDTVDNAKEFPAVLDDFKIWLDEHFGETPNESIFVTCGNWDLRTMLPNQCKLDNLEVPPQMKNWINLKTAFFQATGYYPRSLHDMAKRLEIRLEGKLHSGIDDCLNINGIMKKISEKEFAFQKTDSLETS